MFPVSTKNIPMVKKKPYLYSIIFFITIDVIYQKFYTIKVISVIVNMKIILFYSYFTSQQTVKKTKSCKNKIVLFLKQFTNKGIQSIRFHFILFSISFFFFFCQVIMGDRTLKLIDIHGIGYHQTTRSGGILHTYGPY